MDVVDIRRTKKLRQLAAELHDQCALRGVALIAGEAEDTDDGEQIKISGSTLVYTRKVLRQAIDQLRDGVWMCPCRSRHIPGDSCDLQHRLTGDLNLVGGWTGGAEGPPADDR